MKIALVGSSGGHLTHMYLLKKFWENEDRIWVTFDKTDSKSILKEERFYPCYYPTNRNVKNTIKNTILAFKILRKEKPDLIITTGVLAMLPMCIWMKLNKKKIIYIESFAKVISPTLSGKFMYKYADQFYVQWPQMKEIYPNAIYLGGIY